MKFKKGDIVKVLPDGQGMNLIGITYARVYEVYENIHYQQLKVKDNLNNIGFYGADRFEAVDPNTLTKLQLLLYDLINNTKGE